MTKPKTEKSEWPKLVRAEKSNVSIPVYRHVENGVERFRLIYHDTNGKRKFESAKDQAEAFSLALQKSAALSSFGARVAAVSPAEMAEFVHARDLLKPHNLTVEIAAECLDTWLKTFSSVDAIERALAGTPVGVGKCTEKLVGQAVTDFIAEHRKNGESSVLHVADLEGRLNRLLKGFVCNVSTVDTAVLQTVLDKANGGVSNYEHNRRVLSSFFGWCYCQGYHSENPAATPKKHLRAPGKVYLLKRTVPVSKKNVYRADEMQKLLTAADKKLFPLLVLCSFAGLRTTEAARLRWQDIDFANSRLIVGEDEGKTTGSFRSIKMSQQLQDMLSTFKDRKGYIWPRNDADFVSTIQHIADAMRRCAVSAGIEWKKNAQRHSYISYRLIQGDAIAAIAADAGNSPAVIHSNYKSLRFDDGSFITEADAKAWFAIRI